MYGLGDGLTSCPNAEHARKPRTATSAMKCDIFIMSTVERFLVSESEDSLIDSAKFDRNSVTEI